MASSYEIGLQILMEWSLTVRIRYRVWYRRIQELDDLDLKSEREFFLRLDHLSTHKIRSGASRIFLSFERLILKEGFLK